MGGAKRDEREKTFSKKFQGINRIETRSYFVQIDKNRRFKLFSYKTVKVSSFLKRKYS